MLVGDQHRKGVIANEVKQPVSNVGRSFGSLLKPLINTSIFKIQTACLPMT